MTFRRRRHYEDEATRQKNKKRPRDEDNRDKQEKKKKTEKSSSSAKKGGESILPPALEVALNDENACAIVKRTGIKPSDAIRLIQTPIGGRISLAAQTWNLLNLHHS